LTDFQHFLGNYPEVEISTVVLAHPLFQTWLVLDDVKEQFKKDLWNQFRQKRT
jgi:hypothetical protein